MNANIPAADTPSPAGSAQMASVWRVLVLGLNLWTVVALVPALIAEAVPIAALSALALLPLGLGVFWLARPRLASALLLGVFPLAIVGVVGGLDALGSATAHPPLAMALGALSLLAYGAVTAQVLARPAEREDVRQRPMTALAGDPSARGRRWRRRAILGIAAIGAGSLALVAPFLGGEVALAREWGDSAASAGALTATVGGALGATVLAAFVGPGLRRRPPPSPSRQRWRVAMFLFVAVSGAVVHTLLTQGPY